MHLLVVHTAAHAPPRTAQVSPPVLVDTAGAPGGARRNLSLLLPAPEPVDSGEAGPSPQVGVRAFGAGWSLSRAGLGGLLGRSWQLPGWVEAAACRRARPIMSSCLPPGPHTTPQVLSREELLQSADASAGSADASPLGSGGGAKPLTPEAQVC